MIRSRIAALLAALTVTFGIVVATPTAAFAADQSSTVVLSGFTFSYSGAIRSEAGATTVTFWRNVATDHYWMTYSTKIRDRSTDGYCAKALFRSNGMNASTWGSECNAVWKTYSGTFSDCYDILVNCHSFSIQLGRGTQNGTSFQDGIVGKTAYAPTGW